MLSASFERSCAAGPFRAYRASGGREVSQNFFFFSISSYPQETVNPVQLLSKDSMDNSSDEHKRIKSLFERYLNNQATPEEERELMRAAGEEKWKDLFQGRISSLLEDEVVVGDMRVERASEMVSDILEAYPKAKSSTKLIAKYWLAAASLAFAVMAGAWLFNLADTQIISNTKRIPAPVTPQVAGVFSGKQFVRLPDGSTALLNEKSELSYGASFGKTVREVTLVGEAYFDIAHDEAHPFLVRSGKLTTTVLGTAFNVSAWPDAKEIKVTVTRGRVRVSEKINDAGKPEKLLGVITPNQQITFNSVTSEFKTRETPAAAESEWKEDFLVLDNVSLETAAAMMEAKFDTRIVFANAELKACRIEAGFFNHETLKQVLDVMKGVMKISYEIKSDGNVLIDGKGCK
jgi:transmembrane sensor